MSRETMEWLNTMTLIGFTSKRGNAWHYRAEDQGDESNHYPDAVPVDDVVRRLFNFEVSDAPLCYRDPTSKTPRYVTIPGRKAMVTSDTGDVLGVFKDGYQGHSYREWLIDSVATILDDDVQIGSAGLLRNRAQAWVSVEVPESFTHSGVDYRPHLLAATSYDGSLATSFGRKIQLAVCDNTLSVALGESGQSLKIKHSKYSAMRITDAREALAIVHRMADDFAAELDALTAHKVSDKQFDTLLDALIPVPSDEGRGMTVANKKRDEVMALYRNDERAATWNGTAFGVLQAFNTWNHHSAQVRKGVARGQRNMENVVTGKFATADADVLTVLSGITGTPLVAA
jgi:phage/plasmid-like protein (TIGR03299 family)